MKKTTLLLTAASVLVLGACGGGGGDDTPAPPPAATAGVPDSANQGSAGMVAWLKALIASPADALEPVDASKFTPLLVNDAEPQTL